MEWYFFYLLKNVESIDSVMGYDQSKVRLMADRKMTGLRSPMSTPFYFIHPLARYIKRSRGFLLCCASILRSTFLCILLLSNKHGCKQTTKTIGCTPLKCTNAKADYLYFFLWPLEKFHSKKNIPTYLLRRKIELML